MTYIIFDGNSLYARSWFAAQSVTPDPAEAIKFALKTVMLLLNPNTNRAELKFDRMLFCWDGSEKTDKKGRAEKPVEYHPTKEILKETLTFLFGAAHAEHPHYEGDDVVATAVSRIKSGEVYIISGDKDLMQLQVNHHVHYYCLNTKAVLSKSYINNKWHVKRPSHIAIALAIIGDPVDKIPGIHGWGPKKVQKLFEDIDPEMPFEQVLTTIESKIPDELKESFYESLERTLLNTDVPGIAEPSQIVFADPKEVDSLGMREVSYAYRQVHRAYTFEPF